MTGQFTIVYKTVTRAVTYLIVIYTFIKLCQTGLYCGIHFDTDLQRIYIKFYDDQVEFDDAAKDIADEVQHCKNRGHRIIFEFRASEHKHNRRGYIL